jgi:hypothetical protein
MKAFLVACVALVIASGCGGASTAPSPGATGLSFSQTSLTIARNTSTQLNVIARFADNQTRDVSGQIQLSSSNPAVITVSGGLLTAVGIGTSEITARYGALTATTTVKGRRNTAIAGEVTIADARGGYTVNGIRLRLDDKSLTSRNGSDHFGYQSMTLPFEWRSTRSADWNLEPGAHQFEVESWTWMPGTVTDIANENPTLLYVVDRDTGERVDTVGLPRQQLTITGSGKLVFPVTIKAYTEPIGQTN